MRHPTVRPFHEYEPQTVVSSNRKLEWSNIQNAAPNSREHGRTEEHSRHAIIHERLDTYTVFKMTGVEDFN